MIRLRNSLRLSIPRRTAVSTFGIVSLGLRGFSGIPCTSAQLAASDSGDKISPCRRLTLLSNPPFIPHFIVSRFSTFTPLALTKEVRKDLLRRQSSELNQLQSCYSRQRRCRTTSGYGLLRHLFCRPAAKLLCCRRQVLLRLFLQVRRPHIADHPPRRHERRQSHPTPYHGRCPLPLPLHRVASFAWRHFRARTSTERWHD